MNIFEINNLEWFNSLSGEWKVAVIAIPCLVICFWCKLKYTDKYLHGFEIVDCDEYSMDIPTGVLLIFIVPPFGGVMFVFMLIVQTLATVIFTASLVFIYFLWVMAGNYAQIQK